MAMIAGAVANGGVMMKPVLVKRIENSMGVATHTLETSVYRQAMQPATAELLARAMYENRAVRNRLARGHLRLHRLRQDRLRRNQRR